MESFTTICSLKIRYQEWGADKSTISSWFKQQGNGRHLLFIHGLGSSSDRWLDIPQALSLAGFHTIALDLPGFGGSDKPSTDYTIGYFVAIVEDFLRQKGLDGGKPSLIGHSLGGYVAAQLAAEKRELVDKLVLIDSSGMLQGPTPLLEEYAMAAMSPSKESVRRVFEQMVSEPIRIPEALVDGFIYRIHQQGAQAAFKSAYENSVNTQLGIENLEHIKNPTLIVWGRKDVLIPIHYCEAFRKGIENAVSYVVEDAGHAPFAEKPAMVCELLRAFLLS
ncbi:alpha/beta hydrolase [Nitrososphaera sp.]|uniref:alpha/beta fold hydrolase n=1 Tax=Nitrososphaera sp. TaxID=1971748 RepID=UPI002ED9C53C